MSNNMELILKIANNVDATNEDVDDLIFAICLAERHFGKTIEGNEGGQNKLSIKGVLAGGFGVNLSSKLRTFNDATPLESIQEKRLICDVCYMLTKGNVEGTELTMPSSAKLIKNKHSDFPYVTDVGVCDKYIKLYKTFLSGNENSIIFEKFYNNLKSIVPYANLNGLVLSENFKTNIVGISYTNSTDNYLLSFNDFVFNKIFSDKNLAKLNLTIARRCDLVSKRRYAPNEKLVLPISVDIFNKLKSYKELYNALSSLFLFTYSTSFLDDKTSIILYYVAYGNDLDVNNLDTIGGNK